MTLVLTVIGVALIICVLQDIFQTLFNPSSSGALSSWSVRFFWRRYRRAVRHHPRRLSLAGPVALMLIIVLWTTILILGWALVLWPRLPEQFVLSPGMDPAENGGFWDAIYLSTVTLATLGYGDITPISDGLRLLAPLEALIGFALFTASISWILSVYPVLARRRNLARRVALLYRSGQWDRLAGDPDSANMLVSTLLGLAEQVVTIRNDFMQFPITYYFHQGDQDAALSTALPRMAVLADMTSRHPSTAVQIQAGLLDDAIRDLLSYIGRSFLDLRDVPTEKILRAYAEDHLREAVGEVPKAGEILDESG